MYLTFKFLHVLGVVLLIGNVTASAVWKVFANRTGNPVIVAFAQRLVTLTDWSLTLAGIVLVMVGGYGMVHGSGLDLLSGWLLWGQLLFAASGLVWAAVLLPLQVKQARLARTFGPLQPIGADYAAMSRLWIIWGIVATVPLVAATWVMVFKP